MAKTEPLPHPFIKLNPDPIHAQNLTISIVNNQTWPYPLSKLNPKPYSLLELNPKPKHRWNSPHSSHCWNLILTISNMCTKTRP